MKSGRKCRSSNLSYESPASRQQPGIPYRAKSSVPVKINTGFRHRLLPKLCRPRLAIAVMAPFQLAVGPCGKWRKQEQRPEKPLAKARIRVKSRLLNRSKLQASELPGHRAKKDAGCPILCAQQRVGAFSEKVHRDSPLMRRLQPSNMDAWSKRPKSWSSRRPSQGQGAVRVPPRLRRKRLPDACAAAAFLP
jgi:hypothetical protein